MIAEAYLSLLALQGSLPPRSLRTDAPCLDAFNGSSGWFLEAGEFCCWAKRVINFVGPKLYSRPALNMFIFDSSTASVQLRAY